jgi:hypothetical protein
VIIKVSLQGRERSLLSEVPFVPLKERFTSLGRKQLKPPLLTTFPLNLEFNIITREDVTIF